MNPELPFSIEKAAELIREPGTFGTTLFTIALTAYQDELFGRGEPMDPLELYARLEEDFHARITEAGENKLQALMFALSTDAFYDDPEAFTAITKSLNSGDLGDLVDGGFEDLELAEILWSIYEVGLCRDDDIDFAPPVQRVIDSAAAEVSEEGGESRAHYEQYVHVQKLELASQLSALGVQLPLEHLHQLA